MGSEGGLLTNEQEKGFEAGRPPPFRISDVRAAIPKQCWVKNTWRSMSYVVRDLIIVLALARVAIYLNNPVFWLLYWVAQGTMFWAIFVLGHDCGHGSFSDNVRLNNLVGQFLHTLVLVPYHGWRISHRKHHNNHGHVENDESWHPWKRSPGKSGSHYNPNSDLFLPHEKWDVITSTICWFTMLALILLSTFIFGPAVVLKLYVVPYAIFVVWLDLVTYLHHHGHEEKLPWYRGKEWSYLRGALTTVDQDYGWINKIHHNIETHVIHHLFPQIPHYNLVAATIAAKPVLGKYYREPKKSGPLPFHIFGILARSLRVDHFVSDVGDVVYYQTDPHLHGDGNIKSN